MRISRGFAGALFGIAMTIFSWYGPWDWPAAPAFAVLHAAFPHGGFGDLSFRGRSIAVVVLIAVNVAAWGVALAAALAAARKLRPS